MFFEVVEEAPAARLVFLLLHAHALEAAPYETEVMAEEVFRIEVSEGRSSCWSCYRYFGAWCQ